VLSPGNRAGELRRKLAFYSKYGAEEYYIIDPDRGFIRGYTRGATELDVLPDMNGWVSPHLGVRFEDDPELQLYGPDGRRFLSFVELGELANQERVRADKLAAKLRSLGLDPDAI
jgi:hypothetical protein